MANRKGVVVPSAKGALEKFKAEIASELGVPNYDQIDKGALPARVHGMIGGTMTKRLIELGEQALANGQITNSQLDYNSYRQDMEQDLSQSSVNQLQ